MYLCAVCETARVCVMVQSMGRVESACQKWHMLQMRCSFSWLGSSDDGDCLRLPSGAQAGLQQAICVLFFTLECILVCPGEVRPMQDSPAALHAVLVAFASIHQHVPDLQVTGDPNVPQSQLSFKVHITSAVDSKGMRIAQPQRESGFRIPSHHVLDVDVASSAPLVLTGRYQAEGQVARNGFRDPKWVPVQVGCFWPTGPLVSP